MGEGSSISSALYPLNIVLVGWPLELLPEVRSRIALHTAFIEAECEDYYAVHSQIRDYEHARLFVVFVTNSEDLECVRQLHRTYVGHPLLAVVAEESPKRLLFDVMKAGAMQLVAYPFDSEDVRSALNWFVEQFGYETAQSGVIAVAGVTGGTGCTAFAANLAYEIAQSQRSTCILTELSASLGTLSTYLNLQPRVTTRDLFQFRGTIDFDIVRRALTACDQKLLVLPGDHQAIMPTEPDSEQVDRLIACIARLGETIVVDVPYGFTDTYFRTLQQASQVVLVCSQSFPSIRNARLVCDTLENQQGSPQPILLINQYDPKGKVFTLPEIQKCFPELPLHTVRFDPNVRQATNQGIPLRRVADRSPALDDIRQMMAVLLELEEKPQVSSTLVHRALRLLGWGG